MTFKNEWDAAVAARFGLAYDRFFIYQKIGVAWGDNHFTSVIPQFGGGAVRLAGSVTTPGLLLALGLEYGVLPKWTVKGEVGYIHLGATDMNLSCVAAAPATCIGQPSIVSTNAFAVYGKMGVNYRLYP